MKKVAMVLAIAFTMGLASTSVSAMTKDETKKAKTECTKEQKAECKTEKKACCAEKKAEKK